MPYLADRCQDTSSSTGTGDIILSGVAPTSFRTFFQAFGANVVYTAYAIYDSNITSNWETGYGVYNGNTNTLARVSITASSNSNKAVNFTSGSLIILNTFVEHVAKNSTYGVQYALSRGWAMP